MAYYLVSFFFFIIFETILFSAFCFVFPNWIRTTYVALALFFLTLFFHNDTTSASGLSICFDS